MEEVIKKIWDNGRLGFTCNLEDGTLCTKEQCLHVTKDTNQICKHLIIDIREEVPQSFSPFDKVIVDDIAEPLFVLGDFQLVETRLKITCPFCDSYQEFSILKCDKKECYSCGKEIYHRGRYQ